MIKPPKFLDEPSGKAERGGWGSEQAQIFPIVSNVKMV
jgi:hypothetical protein